jgi:hypothetical protein
MAPSLTGRHVGEGSLLMIYCSILLKTYRGNILTGGKGKVKTTQLRSFACSTVR